MNCTVKIIDNDVRVYSAAVGTNLLEFLRDKGLQPDAPCGGNGTCGKCRVRVSGLIGLPEENEKKLLGEDLLGKGYRLACNCSITSDIEVYADTGWNDAVIMTEGRSRSVQLEPLVGKRYMELEPPELHNQKSDLDRVLLASGITGHFNDLALIRELPGLLRTNDFKVTAVTCGGELLGLEPCNTAERCFGIAVDIGTTTIAAYLYNLLSGERMDVYSMLNPQRKFGADVLTRIEYTMESPEKLAEMQKLIVDCINDIIIQLTNSNNIEPNDIYEAVFAGNTTMMHFLAGIDAGNIAKAPFITVTTAMHRFAAGELKLCTNSKAIAILIPGVSGYIGADTVAAVLSSGMYSDGDISLLVDIGTNGEIVLGGRDWLYSCSTAAGPAFEGANIRNGAGGVTGAIDSVRLEPDVEYTVIGNGKPIGICGSGIVDAIAQMLLTSVIDETGRIAGNDEAGELNAELLSRLTVINGQNAFMLVSAEDSGCDNDISITQKDIRELQNAKAAIAAGIRTLAGHAGISLESISRVYLAGGFGSYIDVESALAVGLLPQELRGRIESIGNAAGEGAAECLLSGEMLREAEAIAKRIKYVELSASLDFVNEYVECMMF